MATKKTTAKTQKTDLTFDEKQKLYVKDAEKKAVKTAIATSLLTLTLIAGTTYLILGPKIFDDVSTQTQEQIVALERNYEYIEQKQAELAAHQAALKAKINSFMGADFQTQLLELGALGSQVQVINERLQMLQETSVGQDILASSATDLQNVVLGMQGRVDTLEDELEQAKLDNDSLADMLDGITGNELKAAAMMLAVSQLRSSLLNGNTYQKDIDTVRMLAGEDPELQEAITKIAPLSQTGILSRDALKRELKSLAKEIVVAELKGEDVSWTDKAKSRFENLISVQKDGLADGDNTKAIVARAQTYMDEGNIKAAIAELQKLEGDSAAVAQPWMTQAEGRLNAENIGPLLSDNILDLIKQASGASVGHSPVTFGQ